MTSRRRTRPARRPRSEEYPALAAFLRGYLHEDFDAGGNAVGDAASDALARFLEDASPEERSALAAEARRLLAAVSSVPAQQLPRLLSALGGAWEPVDGEEALSLLSRMAQAAGGPGGP